VAEGEEADVFHGVRSDQQHRMMQLYIARFLPRMKAQPCRAL
jgi:hypothetical protein